MPSDPNATRTNINAIIQIYRQQHDAVFIQSYINREDFLNSANCIARIITFTNNMWRVNNLYSVAVQFATQLGLQMFNLKCAISENRC